jgi:hypothetical protein
MLDERTRGSSHVAASNAHIERVAKRIDLVALRGVLGLHFVRQRGMENELLHHVLAAMAPNPSSSRNTCLKN